VRHTGTCASIEVRDALGEIKAPDRMLAGVQGASILLALEPFETSAPETTLARLTSLGVLVIIAPGVEAQIYRKCVAAGLLPLPLESATLAEVAGRVASHPGAPLTVDLERQAIEMPGHEAVAIRVDARTRNKLLHGLTDLDEARPHVESAAALRKQDRARRPWLYGG
jgi:3-isopropylmalate/(R)-2-methylmalate dehydratase small subunit